MKVIASVAIVAMISAGAASAVEVREKGAYIGGAIGVSQLESDVYDELEQFPGANYDDDDTTMVLWGGYKFFKWFAVEGRGAFLGNYKIALDDGAEFADLEVGAAALTGNAVFILPFGASGWDIYGQLGLGMLTFSNDISTNVTGLPDAVSDDGVEIVGTAGIGVRWTPTPPLTISLGIDSWATEINDEDFAVNMTRLGVQYNY